MTSLKPASSASFKVSPSSFPISSTAHLRIVPALLGWGDAGAAFTAVLQLGSLVAVLGYFLPDLLRMLRATGVALTDRWRPPEPPARQLGY